MTPPSLSRHEIPVLLLEGINDSAVTLLAAQGYTNTIRRRTALDGPALADALAETAILGIRSRTQMTAAAIDAAPQLAAIGCFSVGTNQVDLSAARRRGIPVFNAPFSNTRSVAELVIGELVMLLRRIVPRSNGAHQGEWDKSALNSREVRGKTLGIVGYGNIGSQLSTLAEAMGMRVLYFDIADRLRHGNAEPAASLPELLGASEIVTLHVPETPSTHSMIGAAELAQMRPGACLINNSRGHVVDLEALAAALRSGHLAGAAIDVFPREPGGNAERFASPLQGIANVILTPHIGGSTEEAQARIGAEVARKLLEFSETGSTVGAVNFPQVQLPPRATTTRYLHVHRNVPGMLGHLNEVFSRGRYNIAAQYLQTDAELGYVCVDADVPAEHASAVMNEISSIAGTIRARMLFTGSK